MPRIRSVLIAAVLSALVLSGCSAVVSVASNTYPDVPNGYAEKVNLFSAEPLAVWDHGRTVLAVVTVGSGSCPPVPTKFEIVDKQTVNVTFVKSPNNPCSADLGPTTHEFKVVDPLDTSKIVTVNLQFDYDTPLDYSITIFP